MKEKAELQQQIEQLESRHYALMQEIEILKQEMKEPEKPQHPTYEDVANEVKPKWFFGGNGDMEKANNACGYYYASEETAEREALRRMWLNIAEYVNRKYEKKSQYHFCINWVIDDNEIEISAYYSILSENTRFNSEAAVKEALFIFGEDNYKKMIGV